MAWFGWIGAVLLAGCGSSTPPAQAPASATQRVSGGRARQSELPGAGGLAGAPRRHQGVRRGHYPEARASFQAAVKKNPTDYEALYNLGMTCEKLQDKAAAEAAYKGAIAAKPDLDTAAAELSALYMDEGRTDDALAAARAGLARTTPAADRCTRTSAWLWRRAGTRTKRSRSSSRRSRSRRRSRCIT